MIIANESSAKKLGGSEVLKNWGQKTVAGINLQYDSSAQKILYHRVYNPPQKYLIFIIKYSRLSRRYCIAGRIELYLYYTA